MSDNILERKGGMSEGQAPDESQVQFLIQTSHKKKLDSD